MLLEGESEVSKVHSVRRRVLVGLLIPILLLSGLFIFPVSAESSWSTSRPSSITTYNETIGNANDDGVASVVVGVTIGQYSENDQGYGGNDHLSLLVSMSANTREGIQYGVGSVSYNWYTVSNPTGITGDDAGANLTLPFPVLLPGDYVTLQFTARQLKDEKRDFIIILEGHYFTIS